MVVDLIANYSRYQRMSRLSPYQRWELSEAKEEIIVTIESGLEESDRLGVLQMDLDAPCDIARQYIERKFRHELNEQCGRSFSFYVRQEGGEEVMLQYEHEELKWIRDFVVMKLDTQTGKVLPTVTIVVNAGEEKVIIEEVFDEVDPLLEDDLDLRDGQGDGDDGFQDF
jgi:hypothetical protein